MNAPIHKDAVIEKFMFLSLLFILTACNSIQAAPDEEKNSRWSFGRSTPTENSVATGQQNEKLHFQGVDRNFILYTPGSYSSAKAVALVVVLHGGHGNAKKAYDRTGFYSLSESEGFVVVYPESVGANWNDGRKTTASEVDDVAYINALIDYVSKQRNIDGKRIYVTGLSNGGIMTQRLACESPQRFAAFASVIANIPVSLQAVCKPNYPVALMMINGSADPLMPPSGGEIKTSRWMGMGGTVLSTQQTAQFWADINHCESSPSATKLPDRDPADGTRIEKIQYTGCQRGSEVVLYSVDGGGHTWPGSVSKPFFKISGTTSYDMKASEVIWAFFNQHVSK